MLQLDDPIDWHRDLVSGKQAPQVHWSEIDPLDPEKVGDSKVVWELNRHQWVVRLAQAWAFTGDERYAEFYRFPVFVFRLDWTAVAFALVAATAAPKFLGASSEMGSFAGGAARAARAPRISAAVAIDGTPFEAHVTR